MRALVIDEDLSTRRALREALATRDAVADVASDGDDGLWFVAQHHYDVIIASATAPTVGGLELTRRVRERHPELPIVVTGRDPSERARADALASAASDYVVKPLQVGALVARVSRLVEDAQGARPAWIRIGDLTINTLAQRAVRRGRPIALSPREYTLLEYLALRAGSVVSRSEIWENVYDANADARSNVVDVYISYLRRKLGAPALIITRRRYGYLLREALPVASPG